MKTNHSRTKAYSWQTSAPKNKLIFICKLTTNCTMKLKIGQAQNILYQFNIFCTGTKTNCTKVEIELQHIHNCSYYSQYYVHGIFVGEGVILFTIKFVNDIDWYWPIDYQLIVK